MDHVLQVTRTLVTTTKVEEKMTIAVISDIHYSKIFKIWKLDRIRESLITNKPDYICIPGDLIDSTKILKDEKKMALFYGWLERIALIAPVYLVLGNHDMMYQRKHKNVYDYHEEYIKRLKEIPNVIVLHNEVVEDKKTKLAGITLPYHYYYNKERREDKTVLNTILQENSSLIPSVSETQLQILLLHSPVHVHHMEELKAYDIVLTGHMHNGMVPPGLNKLWKSHRGIMSPEKRLFPTYTRGVITKEKQILVISGGITKIQEYASFLLRPFNHCFPMSIHYIEFHKKKEDR